MKVTAREILQKIEGRPLECAAEYTESRAMLLKVAKLRDADSAKLWPYVSCHAYCLRQLRKQCDVLDGSEMLVVYNSIASTYVNNPKNWR